MFSFKTWFAVGLQIKDFYQKIDSFFDYVKNEETGKRMIAKIQSQNANFTREETMKDFSALSRVYLMKNAKSLSDFFKREFKANLEALYETFVEEL